MHRLGAGRSTSTTSASSVAPRNASWFRPACRSSSISAVRGLAAASRAHPRIAAQDRRISCPASGQPDSLAADRPRYGQAETQRNNPDKIRCTTPLAGGTWPVRPGGPGGTRAGPGESIQSQSRGPKGQFPGSGLPRAPWISRRDQEWRLTPANHAALPPQWRQLSGVRPPRWYASSIPKYA